MVTSPRLGKLSLTASLADLREFVDGLAIKGRGFSFDGDFPKAGRA